LPGSLLGPKPNTEILAQTAAGEAAPRLVERVGLVEPVLTSSKPMGSSCSARAHVQVVETKRVDSAVRQSLSPIWGASTTSRRPVFASLLASGAKLTAHILLINALDEDTDRSLSIAAKRIGGPLLFGRNWERLGIAGVLGELLKHPAFEFAVERAVFVDTLHRLFVSGSDRDCSSWMEDYDIAGVDGLDLHHFYRAMAWLGEELEEKPAGALAPGCVKDVIARSYSIADVISSLISQPYSWTPRAYRSTARTGRR
jgi:hypothetical protein